MPQLKLPANRVLAASSVLVFLGVASISSSALRFFEGAASVFFSSSESELSESSSEASLLSEESSESS